MISENLPQGSVWENFYRISAVPHVSGHEEQLALRLVEWAEKEGNPLYPVPVIWSRKEFKDFILSVQPSEENVC